MEAVLMFELYLLIVAACALWGLPVLIMAVIVFVKFNRLHERLSEVASRLEVSLWLKE